MLLRTPIAPAAVMALAAGLVGCASGPDEEPVVCHSPEAGVAQLGAYEPPDDPLKIGWALEQEFLPYHDGDVLDVRPGCAALPSFAVNLAVENFEPHADEASKVPITVVLRVPGGVDWGEFSSHISYDETIIGGEITEKHVDDLDGVARFFAIWGQVAFQDVQLLDGAVVQLDAEVVDGCGRVIETSQTLTLAY